MTRIITVLLLLAMGAHLIRPLGLPGLRQRRDFWKIGLFAFAMVMITVLLREVTGV